MTVDDAIDALNSMLVADPDAITALVETRLPCNRALAEHPTAQVCDDDDVLTVGLLGILNGIFGKHASGWGYICADLDGGKIVRFKRTPDAYLEGAGGCGSSDQAG